MLRISVTLKFGQICPIMKHDGRRVPRKVKRSGERRGITVRFEAKRKGSHGTLYFGSARTVLQDLKKELPPGTFHAMLKQLGLTLRDFDLGGNDAKLRLSRCADA